MDKNNDTKTCPFCGEEIKVTAKKCKHCKNWLPAEDCKISKTEEKQIEEISNPNIAEKNVVITSDKNQKKTIIILSITIAVLIIAIIGIFITLHFVNFENSQEYLGATEYKDKFIFKESLINQDSPTLQEISQINQAEKELKNNLLNNNDNLVKDEFFNAFLEVLESYTKNAWYDFSLIDQNKDINNKNGISYKYIITGSKEGFDENGNKTMYKVGYYKIINPLNNSLALTINGEGYSFTINYEYLYKTYAQYLGNDFTNYLKIKAKQTLDMNYSTMYSDGYLSIDYLSLVDWILDCEKYIKTNPIILKDKVNDEIRDYTRALMWNNQTFDIQTGIMSDKAKNAYEKFLNNADKSSEEYLAVNKAYHILKRNNFKSNEEFNNFYQKYQNNEYQDYSINQ